MDIQIRSKGNTLGTMHIFNPKKILAICGIGFTLFTVTGCQKEEIQEITIVAEDISENRYDGVFYEVQNGDTLTGIVYGYEEDANKVYQYVDEITKRNNIDRLKARDIIELVGVPESKLEHYGYSSDYEKTGNDHYIEDAREFLINNRDWVIKTEENEVAVSLFEEKADYLEILYQDYLEATDEEVRSYLEERLVEEYGLVLEELRELSGRNFDHHHQAHKIINEIGMEMK